MTSERGGHSSGDGSPPRDTGTQTVKAVILIAAVVIVGILVLKNVGSGPKPINSTSPTTTPAPIGAPAPTVTTTPPTTRSATTTPPTTAPAHPTTTVPVNPASVKVLVLNGSQTSGAAAYFTNKLHTAGYNTLAASNATAHNVTTTMVYMNTPAAPAAAVAHTLGLAPSSVVNSVPPNAPVNAVLLQQDNPNVLVVIGTDIAPQATSAAASSTTTTPSTPTTPPTTAARPPSPPAT